MLHKFLRGYFMSGPINHLWNSKEIYIVTVQQVHIKDIMCDESQKGINTVPTILYKLLFSRGFYFREFREPDPRENFHFNSCLFIVMTTSEKSRN